MCGAWRLQTPWKDTVFGMTFAPATPAVMRSTVKYCSQNIFFVETTSNIAVAFSFAMKPSPPVVWQRLHAPSPDWRLAHAPAMFAAWKSVSFMQPANCDISLSTTVEGESWPGGVGPVPLRSSSSLESHATIFSFSAVVYVRLL